MSTLFQVNIRFRRMNQKYLYTYRIWGRMLYNPDTPREVWQRYLRTEFGPAARDCEIALGHASRVMLLITTAHTPSCSNNGYWPDRLEAIDQDLADMEKQSQQQPAAPNPSAPTWAAAISRPGFAASATTSRPRCQHLPQATFTPGKPMTVEMTLEAGYRLASARLHYRHVDQSDAYRVAEMTARGGRYRAEIPGDYTDSAYPMLYYFELHDPRGNVWLHPGLNADLANQPYFVVRQV